MKEQSDFKPGQMYENMQGALYHCVGHSKGGMAVIQRLGDHGELVGDSSHLVIGPHPEYYIERREPREFFVCFWHDNVVSVRRTELPETERDLYTDVIKVREVLD